MLEGVCKPLPVTESETLPQKTLLDVGGVCKWPTKVVWRNLGENTTQKWLF